MDEKINPGAIDRYSEEFATKISTGFFAAKDKITGPEILALNEIHQINLFIIRDLLHSWKAESDKLRSPYFDYKAAEVTEALTAFQNTLSNHISIAASDFFPLLKKAVQRTLNLILSPYDFYSDVLDRNGQGLVHVNNLKMDVRYLKINRAPLERLVQKLEEKKLTMVQRNETFALLDSILEEVGFTPEDIDEYLAKLSNVVPLKIEALYEPKQKDPEPGTQTEPLVPLSAPPVITPEPVVTKAIVTPVIPNKEKTKTSAQPLSKIVRLKENLTINQKFMFTKILFHGDFEIFSQAIDRIDVLDNLTQAETYLRDTWPEWDRESTEYQEFLSLLERRFA